MPKADTSFIPDEQICKDNMRLTVTNIYPVFPENQKQEARQKISARLYKIFEKYASYVLGGRC